MLSVPILVLAILTTESSYLQETERAATSNVADTIQFWLARDTCWRIRTYAIDHDIHIYSLGSRDDGSQLGVDDAAGHIREHYDGIIARSIALELPEPGNWDEVQRVLSRHQLSGMLEIAGNGVAFYNPDRGEYRTKSAPKASAQAGDAVAGKPTFAPLPAQAAQLMDRQRAYVTALVARHFPGQSLKRSEADFLLLQKVIDARLIAKDQTWELQALGIAFGDALAGAIPELAWWEVTDEYGTDPTLRYKETALQINALTMISKRVEDGEEVDLAEMARWIRAFIKDKAHEYQ